MRVFILLLALALLGCPAPSSGPPAVIAIDPASKAARHPASTSGPTTRGSVVVSPASILALSSTSVPSATQTSVTLLNTTGTAATVNVSFGADSVVNATAWPFCTSSGPLVCSFSLAAKESKVVPSNGYLNATIAFNGAVGCGTTKAELNVNNPAWYDVVDISLVDGFSNKIQITMNGTVLGPPNGKDGNEKVLGLYPFGCDICVAQQHPPCGIPAGGTGCKAGTQNNPTPPCQQQGPTMGGGGSVKVELL